MGRKKKASGRPPLPKAKLRLGYIGARVEPEMLARLKKFSAISGLARSTVLRFALKAYLDREAAKVAA